MIIFLPGCAATISEMLYPAVRGSTAVNTATFHDTNESPEVEWISILPGRQKKPESTQDITQFPIVSSGNTETWRWTIRSKINGIAESFDTSFESLKENQEKTAISIDPLKPVSDWESAIHRLFLISEYLLSDEPPEARIEVILIPESVYFVHHARYPLHDPFQIELAIELSPESSYSASKELERIDDLMRILARIGSQIQFIAMRDNILTSTMTEDARAIKQEANAGCWLTAARRALYAGTEFPVRPPPDDMSMAQMAMALPVFRSMHERHPDDLNALQFLSVAALLRDQARFLEYQQTRLPVYGTDIHSIDALLNFCRNYLRYHGNILEEPMPMEKLKSSHFFIINDT